MRAQPFARFVRPVRRILLLTDPAPETYHDLATPEDTKSFPARTAAHLFQILQATGAEVVPTCRPEDILDHKDEIDFVFSARATYDYPSVDVPVAALCELAGVPCLNGNTLAIATARDKTLCKLAAQRCGLDTPDWITIRPTDALDDLSALSYPRVIKWVTGGNSFSIDGDGLVRSAAEAAPIARQWQRAGHTVMAETFVPGTDLVVGVYDRGPQGLAIGRVVRVDTDHPDNIQTYDAKILGRGKRRRSLLTDITVERQVHDAVRKLHNFLKPLDCYRVDFRWNPDDGILHFLEVNPTANIEPESIFVQSLAKTPGDHEYLMRAVLQAALDRHGLRLPARNGNAGKDPLPNADASSPATRPLRKLLYLAQFAPLSPGDAPPANDPDWGNISQFHDRLYRTLCGLGLSVIPTRRPDDIARLRDRVDFVFSVYEGSAFPSSGLVVPALCEAAGLPFFGAPSPSLTPDIDKQAGKLLAARLGIDTPPWIRFGPNDATTGLDRIRYPAIVKWQYGGNSKYISPEAVVATPEAAAAEVAAFQARGLPVLVEEFIHGTNLTTAAAVLDGKLHLGETVQIDTDAPGNLQTYDQKIFDDGERRKSLFNDGPAIRRIHAFMTALYSEIRPIEAFRADFRFDPASGALHFLEVNMQCNLDPFGTFCQSAVGGPNRYAEMIEGLLSSSLTRQGFTLPRQLAGRS